MKHKIHSLSGVDLNRAIAKMLGRPLKFAVPTICGLPSGPGEWLLVSSDAGPKTYPLPNYCGDWAAGGPLIEPTKMSLWREHDGLFSASIEDYPSVPESTVEGYGATRLEAAMRCLLSGRYYDSVELEDV